MSMTWIDLPHPPSVNHYWGRRGNRVFLSKRGRLFREEVIYRLKGLPSFTKDVRVDIFWHPPDNRRRDIDNIIKPTLDALQHGGVYEDDSQIVSLLVKKLACCSGGKVVILVEEV